MSAAPTWVAFLRGMNLGGRRITNDQLAVAVEACGCAHVRTYQASGNVVVTDARPEAELAAALEAGLAQALGYPVPTFLRAAAQVWALAGAVPFTDAELGASRGKRQVVFLHREPDDAALAAIAALVPDGDLVRPAGRELHWLPASGLADNALDLAALDRITGGTTVRTHGTVERLAARFL